MSVLITFDINSAFFYLDFFNWIINVSSSQKGVSRSQIAALWLLNIDLSAFLVEILHETIQAGEFLLVF